VSPVYSDWSKLEPYKPEQAVFTRRYADFTPTLIPADDYGPLISFPGAQLSRAYEWGGYEDYTLLGLATLQGEVVADPVFTSVFPLIRRAASGEPLGQPDVLVLEKTQKDASGRPQAVAALAARDGSWCTAFDYRYDWELLTSFDLREGIPMMRGDRAVAFLSPKTGQELRVVDCTPFLEPLGVEYPWNLLWHATRGERYTVYTSYDENSSSLILDLDKGTILELPGDVRPVGDFDGGLCPARDEGLGLYGYINESGKWAIPCIYLSVQDFQDGMAPVQDREARYHIIDAEGEELYAFPELTDHVWWDGEMWWYKVRGRQCYLDETLSPVPLPEDFTGANTLEGGWFGQNLDSAYALWNRHTGSRIDFPGMDQGRTRGGWALLSQKGDIYHYFLARLETGEIRNLGRWSYACFERDCVTGADYLRLDGLDGEKSQLQDLEGRTLWQTDRLWEVSLTGSLVQENADGFTALTTLDGETVFRWNYLSVVD